MHRYIVVYYNNGQLQLLVVEGHDPIGVIRKVTKTYHINTCAVVNVHRMERAYQTV